MGRKRSQERSQEGVTESAGEMHERLWSCRREEPEASFDEIMERVRQEREAMMKPLLEELGVRRQARGSRDEEIGAGRFW